MNRIDELTTTDMRSRPMEITAIECTEHTELHHPIVIASQNPLRGKFGIRTVPNRHCEGAPRLWQSLTPEAFTNIRQILVLNSEAWQLPNQWFRLFNRRHLGTRDRHVAPLLAISRKTVCQRWIVLFLCLLHCRKTTYAANREWAVSDAD